MLIYEKVFLKSKFTYSNKAKADIDVFKLDFDVDC